MRRSIFLAPLLSLACVTSYSGSAPLEYADIPYTSVDGEAWPTGFLPLPKTAKRHALPKHTSVCYVELEGEGRPVVFIHGLGSYLKYWRYQLDAFAAAGHRVVAIDMLGYGKSDKPSTFPYTMEAMADVLREAFDALDVRDPILIGHSMGGQTALSYAIRYPKDLSALVLTAPAGFEKFSAKEKAWFRKVMTVPLIMSTDEQGIWRSIRRNNFSNWTSDYEWMIEERVRLAGSRHFSAYAYANVRSVHGLTETDFIRGSLDKVKAPTLIIHGDADRLIPNPYMHGGETVEIMTYGHERIVGSKLVSLEGCGHMLQMDCAEGYNREVEKFLATVP